MTAGPTGAVIDDPEDPRVADYVGLKNPDRRIATEAAGGFFIGEGLTVVRRLLASDRSLRSILVNEANAATLNAELRARPDVHLLIASSSVFRSIVGFNLHRGILSAVDRFPLPAADALLRAHDHVLLLERITDHENLGSLFRSAAGLGFGAMLLCPETADPLYRRAVRVSMGAAALLPYVWVADWPSSLPHLRRHGHRVIALTPDSHATDLAAWPVPRRVVLMAGSEGPGLRAAVIDAADARVTIPMPTAVDSLNVGTAAEIAMHHVITRPPRA